MRVLLHTVAPVLAKGLRSLNAADLDVEVCTGNPAELGWDSGQRPDVILLDSPGQIDFAVLSELMKRYPGVPVVLWVYTISVEVAHQARSLGIRGVLRKDLTEDLLIRCVHEVARGELWFDRALLNSMLQVREVHLSPRERQLLWLISQGFSNKQLAAELEISEGTVKVYLAKLFRKVGVHDRYELAMYGLRNIGMDATSRSAPAEFASALVVPGGLRRYA